MVEFQRPKVSTNKIPLRFPFSLTLNTLQILYKDLSLDEREVHRVSEPVKDYLNKVEKELQPGNTTEHSHRPHLKSLIESFDAGNSFMCRLMSNLT